MTPPCQITTTPFFFVAAAAAAPRAAFFLSPSPFFCRRTATAAERPQPFWREKREKPKPIPREQHPSSGLSGRRPLIQPRFWACRPDGDGRGPLLPSPRAAKERRRGAPGSQGKAARGSGRNSSCPAPPLHPRQKRSYPPSQGHLPVKGIPSTPRFLKGDYTYAESMTLIPIK